jgi:hypothetical protein
MTDIHPDDLLDRKREGTLDEASRARLEAHLEGCRACAIEARMADDFAGEGASRPGDDDVLARAIEGALQESPRARSRWPLRVAVALAAVLVVALSWAGLRRWTTANPPVVAPSVASESAIASVAPSAPPIATIPVLPSATVVPSAAPTPSAPKPVLTAAELFARANDARKNGDSEAALRTYRELQKLHPTSAEAVTSRVSLGRLLLDRLGDPTGARKEFSAYLAAAPGGTLDEEARVGLALASAKLGDVDGERSAWRSLLAKHPDSVQADRARKRLEELGP